MKLQDLYESQEDSPNQDLVGKSKSIIAKAMESQLKNAGIKLKSIAPSTAPKSCIWEIESSDLKEDEKAFVSLNAKTKGGRGLNKPKILTLSIDVYNTKTWELQRPKALQSALTYKNLGEIYKKHYS